MAATSQGLGALFADPSSNQAREFFRAKPRAMTDKLVTVPEAVGRLVNDGDYLAIDPPTGKLPTSAARPKGGAKTAAPSRWSWR